MTEHERSTRATSCAEALAGRAGRAVSRDGRLGCMFVDDVGDDGKYGWMCWDRSGDIGNWVEVPDAPGRDAATVLAMWERETERR